MHEAKALLRMGLRVASTYDCAPYFRSLEHHFTGKERDAESGLDYFGARYYGSSMGRFMSPDPAGLSAVKLANPQTWNWYAYVQNNPLRYTDPTGMYTCADDHNKCATDRDKAFEAARQNDLQSKDKGVIAAAKAYGDPTKDNHVGVQFTDAKNGNTSLSVSTDGKTVTSQITVSIPNGATGTALDGIVGHEGTHVDQGEALLGSFKPNGSFDGTLNLSSYGRELPAYQNQANIWQQSGQSWTMNGNGQFVINPGDTQGQVNNTINQFLKDPSNGYGVTPQSPGAPWLTFHEG
jgi:RHS repeat-associated protein